MELIDIYDANMRSQGVMARDEAHRRGVWHRTVHLWLVDPCEDGRLIFQLRGPAVIANPGKFDATAAGHMVAGEDDLAGLREAREELGVEIPAALHHLGYRTEVTDMPNGDFNREFQSIFLACFAFDPARFAPDPAEVHGLFALRLAALMELLEARRPEVSAHGIQWDEARGQWHAAERCVATSDLVPRFLSYYLNVAIMAERMLAGKSPLAIG